jgi:transcriptional regulator with XRE-family HTH domain
LSSFQRARESLGRQLREIRETTGLNGKEFAVRLHWQPSKVSRIETGQRTPSRSDIVLWTEAANANDQAEALIARLSVLDEMYATWKRQLKTGMSTRQRKSLDLEGGTRILRIFECGIIPGILQTPDYARRVLEISASLAGAPADDLDDAVLVRMQRQQILYEHRQKVQIVVTEGSLLHPLVGSSTMREQIDRLVSATTLPSVSMGVIPARRMLGVAPTHGFYIFDDQLVMTETISAELTITDPAEIELYMLRYRILAEAAVYRDDARALLLKIQESYAE